MRNFYCLSFFLCILAFSAVKADIQILDLDQEAQEGQNLYQVKVSIEHKSPIVDDALALNQFIPVGGSAQHGSFTRLTGRGNSHIFVQKLLSIDLLKIQNGKADIRVSYVQLEETKESGKNPTTNPKTDSGKEVCIPMNSLTPLHVGAVKFTVFIAKS